MPWNHNVVVEVSENWAQQAELFADLPLCAVPFDRRSSSFESDAESEMI
jgi:hypothetical protein